MLFEMLTLQQSFSQSEARRPCSILIVKSFDRYLDAKSCLRG